MELLIAHAAGAVASFWLGVQLKLGTVVVASLTGLLGGFHLAQVCRRHLLRRVCGDVLRIRSK